MSEKATPRPWEWDSGIIPPDGPETYSDIYVDGGDTIIARVNDRIAEGDANARLIVEAVNSYASLKARIQVLETHIRSISNQCGNVVYNCEQRPADNERHLSSWKGVKEYADAALNPQDKANG